MRSAPRLAAALVSALAILSSWEGAGHATDKVACVAASDQGQGLRLDGKLTAAREQLLACADPSCPSIVRAACANWLVELDKQIPSMILVARDGAGNDVLGVQVSLDGGALREAVSGRPISLDPGRHLLRFVAPDGKTLDRVVVLAEGEQRRLVEATFSALTPAATAPRLVVSPSPPVTPHAPSHVPWPAWGFTVGAAAAWTAFGVFALDGHLEYESAASSCNGRCPPDRYSSINTKFIVADISLGAAAVASGIAVVLFLTHPSQPVAPRSGALVSVFSF
jgi:hypothetical protein